ncbi:nitric oxide associated protein 1 [Apophysomyces ossiformis]|uniref:Nitric oxide associated protein 1 n=1 Tax=Apophysomyces ossiformis TaxID=679940 RepID=A0A8H7BTL0_9FUNG|nr:nitric oxide associated protein 1 [Apophysomyces ossiformis]
MPIVRLQAPAFGHDIQVATLSTSSAIPSESATSMPTECPGCGAPFQQDDPCKPGYMVSRDTSPHGSIKTTKKSNNTLSHEEYQAMLKKLDPETRALLEGEQEENEEEEGKVLNDGIDQTQLKESRLLCQRCFSLQHHQHATTDTSPQFLRKTQQYGSLSFLRTKRNPLILAVCDITDLPSSLGDLPKLLRQNNGARVILAANKFDMIPSKARAHEQRIKDWIVQYVKKSGVDSRQILRVSLVSAKKGWGINGLMKHLRKECLPTDDVYVIGCTNVGKSAIINQMLSQASTSSSSLSAAEYREKKAKLRSQYHITSAPLPGTTIGTISIPLRVFGLSPSNVSADTPAWMRNRMIKRDRFLIDTPGIINDQQLIHRLPFKEQKRILRKGELHPVTYRLTQGKTVLLQPSIRIDVVEATSPVLFTFFSPIDPHISKISKLTAKDPSHQAVDRPISIQLDALRPLPELISVQGRHRMHASVDLAFSSFGWVAVTGAFEQAKFRIWLPEDVDPYKVFQVRDPPLLPYEFRGSIRKFYGSS